MVSALTHISTLALAAGAAHAAVVPGTGSHLHARAVPSGWSLVVTNGNDGGGCYMDSSNPRVLTGYAGRVGGSSIDKMIAECSKRGFSYAGLEYGGEIYCASSLPSDLRTAPSSACNVKCSSGETCGGAYRMNLYTNVKPAEAVIEAEVSTWNALGCWSDSSNPRTLKGYSFNNGQMTIDLCQQRCSAQGYKYAGVQYYNQCYCDNSYGGRKIADSSCNTACPGGDGICGGAWALSLYENSLPSLAAPALTSSTTTRTTTAVATTATPTTTARTTTAVTTTTTRTTPVPTSTNISVPSSFTPASSFPASSGEKQIYAHHMVGNTYPYGPSDWQADIAQAKAAGIDGFFLNIGYDEWQPKQVGYAYAAAQAAGFKVAISFDMTVFGCGDASRVPLFRNYLATYLSHPAAAKYRGKSIVTTFAGESCTFGAGSVNAGWATVFAGYRDKIWFAPAFNTDPMRLPSFDIDAETNWGSAWPDKGKEIETSRDEWFMKQLGSKGYIGTVSPLFATHLSYKNWIWRGDDMLFANRWEQLLGMRDRIDQVQVLAWNDYGESIYLNDIRGDMPPEAKLYATNDFPHTDLLSLQAFYSAAWKTGKFPAITKDQIWMMARPHAAGINIPNAPLRAPDNRELTNDNFYAQIHLLADANVVLCSGSAASSCTTKQGTAGINRFSGPLVAGQTPSIRVERGGKVSTQVTAPMAFNGSPTRYNYNYWIKSS